MKDRINPTGVVEFTHHYEDGSTETLTVNNLVVLQGRERLAKLLGGDETDPVQFFRIGTGNTAVTAEQTALQTQVNILPGQNQKAVDSVTYPADHQVRFNFSLLSNEGNGNSLSEFALYTADGLMFARVVRPPFTKTNAAAITGTWTINF